MGEGIGPLVRCLDLSPILEFLTNQYNNELEFFIDQTYGYCEINKKLYLLSSDGLGFPAPVTKNDVAGIKVAAFQNGQLKGINFVNLNSDDIKQLPVKEEQELADFINPAVDHCQIRYDIWSELLKPIQKKVKKEKNELKLDWGQAKDLKKYSSFLVNRICECPGIELVAASSECHCGCKKNHLHCKTCGAIKNGA